MKSSHFLSKAPGEVPEPVGATNVRMPSTQYLVVDSADRNQNSSLNPIGASGQAWNNFRIQKRQAILNAFARRIQPAEIRFAWFIPNITKYNNTLWISVVNDPNLIAVSLPLNDPTTGAYVGFYTPTEICTALNTALASAITNPPVLSYDAATLVYTLTADALNPVVGIYASPLAPTVLDPATFGTTASLFKTLGFTIDQQGVLFDGFMSGCPTMSSYTDYVDICSDKMMYYTDVKDGSSSDRASSTSVMIRLYATDEVSLAIANGVPLTCSPFVIHRQFKNAKSIQWNPEAVIDWMDVQVYDMYGNLVPLPRHRITSTQGLIDGAYPDFQITFLASEN